ncbi:ShlB/FhaC/HecB family hemolysin secretion/activation protein [Neisseria sp.]|uniref:ShlB/FhaC/HecB family hemolysin secretion/activation protein n=1 Tax=Neisseria sp. TaxID=192066 RepID=UPI0026DA815D|nr:ShlB/FhaC/HecB family hemolysin secretion/activation protein [Neisseria sp.]MDO4907531.1 ShlB/FhaC/HecB family hemolysin secretion/activation protein [Neisseria sp.]
MNLCSAIRLYFPALCIASAVTPVPAGSLPAADIEQRQSVQEAQRQLLLHQPQPDVRLDAPPVPAVQALPQGETPCFAVNRISLEGEEAGRFGFALERALKQSGFEAGMCLGAQGINRIMTLAQNALIGRGYTTTRILAAPQDLNGGVLVLTVMPGRIREIRVDMSDAQTTHADRIVSFQNEFPVSAGEVLNLRALEQGLENLKRIPTAEADIRIVPADKPSESDVVVVWRQREVPFRVSAGADDGGSRATGRYQGSITLSADNPLGLSDLFYASYNRDLGHKASYTDAEGRHTGSGTNGYNLHYSVPFGYWQVFWNHGYYRYHQAVAGDSQNYDYNGRSHTGEAGLGRLLYRDARRKTHITAKLWQRESESFIDDAEIEVQRRRTAGWAVGATHKEYLGRTVLDLGLGYKRGTGRNRSLSAPEEAFGEGTSRIKILTADAGANVPFEIGPQSFAFDSRLHAQRNKTPLTPQDKIAIGNRYTVRGFDGETVLAAERGWYWRNDLSWQYRPNHQLYAGADGGRVSGASAGYLPGRGLSGAALGVRGQTKAGGVLSYDLFAAKPLHKPERFQTAETSFGFNLNYSF